MRAHNLLAGRGGVIQWAGMPWVCAYLGITDVEGLIDALEVIATHRPKRDDDPGNDDSNDDEDPLGLN